MIVQSVPYEVPTMLMTSSPGVTDKPAEEGLILV